MDTGCRLEDLPRMMDNRDGWWERVKGIPAVDVDLIIIFKYSFIF